MDIKLRELSPFLYVFAALIEGIAVIFGRKFERRERRRVTIGLKTLTGASLGNLLMAKF
jgi:hypothetical protein